MQNLKTTAAQELKELLVRFSSLIEEYTKKVCPDCTDVCCKQKHGMFQERDIAYLAAVGVDTSIHDPALPLDGPCQFLGPTGCVKPRWQRAWKCTWYFCEALIKAMEEGPQQKARLISEMTEKMLEVRKLI